MVADLATIRGLAVLVLTSTQYRPLKKAKMRVLVGSRIQAAHLLGVPLQAAEVEGFHDTNFERKYSGWIKKPDVSIAAHEELLGTNVQGRLLNHWFPVRLPHLHQLVRRRVRPSVAVAVAVWNGLVVGSGSHPVSLRTFRLAAALLGFD